MGAAEDRAELVTKLKALSAKLFPGKADAWQDLFSAYDANKDGAINRAELEALLTDAGVGNVFSRGHWVTHVILALDTAEDGTVSRVELESAIASTKPPKATGTKKPITRAEARKLAELMIAKPGKLDLDSFTNDELGLIEEESIKLGLAKKPATHSALPVTSAVPPIPTRSSSSSFGEQLLVGVLGGLIIWALTKRRR